MNYKKYIIIFATVLVSVSCDSFLDLKPISEETTDNAYSRESQMESALVGAYQSFHSSEYYIWDFLIYGDVRSDNSYAGGNNPEIIQADLLTISPVDTRVYKNWSNIYNAILKANTVIDKLAVNQDPWFSEERKEEMRGEALFLRAYHYFTLVKLYGGVPLVLEATKSAHPDDVNIPRSSVEDVYQQIILDLENASEVLPHTFKDINGNDLGGDTNKARATYGAAQALLAKVYAQNNEWENSLVAISKVENSSAGYSLLSNYEHLFDMQHENNDESILEIQFIAGAGGKNYGPQLLLPPSLTNDSFRKFVTPSVNLIEAYDKEGDVIRKRASILNESVDWLDQYWGNEKGTSIPFYYKWKNPMGWNSTDNTYLLRFGDIILLKAEALNEIGNTGGALTELNKIRERVNLSPVQSGLSKDDLRLKILNERRLELANEGQRWDDLVRHDLIVSTMNNLVEIDLRTEQAVNYNMTEAKILLPIPQLELDRNPALEQNPL